MAEPKVELAIAFDTIRDKNLEQLRVLNRAIFPINYQEKVYQDILACGEVTQLAYHNDVLVGAIACRLEKTPQVREDVCFPLQADDREGDPWHYIYN